MTQFIKQSDNRISNLSRRYNSCNIPRKSHENEFNQIFA